MHELTKKITVHPCFALTASHYGLRATTVGEDFVCGEICPVFIISHVPDGSYV